LGAGSIIHAVSNEQDMRKMGGLKNILPFSYAITLIGSLALIGFPFLSGFYSKDTILEISFSKYTFLSHFSFYLGTFAAFFTAFYSTRLIFLVFLGSPNGNKISIINSHEGSWRMSFPLFLLAVLSIFIGFFTKDLLIGFGTNFWMASIFVLPQNYVMSDVEFLNIFFKQMPLFFTLLGIFFALYIHIYNMSDYLLIKKSKSFNFIYTFFNKKWYFDKLYNKYICQNFLYYSYHFSYKDLDRGFLEEYGPFGLTNSLKKTSEYLKYYQSGNIFHYLFLTAFAILIIIIVYI
jgi:NADH-ubiquinone oxidoreductase chain 5